MSLLNWFRKPSERDLREEMAAHLELDVRERVARGADPEQARHEALREFGNVMNTAEAAREVWRPRWAEWLGDLAGDMRYAARSLARKPLFALTVAGVLTLGIGLNATVFTMLKSIALSPLSGVPRATELVVMYAETGQGRELRLSYPDFKDIRDRVNGFESMFGSSFATVNIGRGRGSRQVGAELVTGNYFSALGVGAAMGRTLLPSDEAATGSSPVAVISDRAWRHLLGADPGIIGRRIDVNNYPFTVVGVASPQFHGTIVSYDIDVFIPVTMMSEVGILRALPGTQAGDMLTDRRAAVLFPHGFLKAGVTMAQVAAQARQVWASLSRNRALSEITLSLRTVGFRSSPAGGQRYVLPVLAVLSAMGLLVLAIACANIGGLMLVRGISRRGEIAVRLALGAARPRIIRLLLLENLLLAAPGALLGVLLAQRGIPVLVGYAEKLAEPQPLFFNLAVDGYVIAFAVLTACGSALAVGLAPALRSSRMELVSTINDDATPRGASRSRLRSGLVVVQVAVSMLLLVGAGLVMRSVTAAERADAGFDRFSPTAVALDVRQNDYDESRGRAFYRRLLQAARAQPGVESATLAWQTPLAFLERPSQKVTVDGYEPRRGEDVALMYNAVAPEYFRTLRIALLAGRAFEERDDEASAPVMIVNETLARRFWGSPSAALGRRIRAADGAWRSIIGVAADVKYLRMDEAPRPYFYVPFFQSYRSLMVLHTRGATPMDRLLQQAQAAVAAADQDLPILSARSMEDQCGGSLIFMNFASLMLAVFGVTGMALAAMGTYGMVSYSVTQSTREIGIRMALGASARSVVRGFVRHAIRLGTVGAALGMVGALGLKRLMGSVLFGVEATDGRAFAAALGLVLGTVVLATVVPAWRASRTDPLKALRHQ